MIAKTSQSEQTVNSSRSWKDDEQDRDAGHGEDASGVEDDAEGGYRICLGAGKIRGRLGRGFS